MKHLAVRSKSKELAPLRTVLMKRAEVERTGAAVNRVDDA